MKSRQLLQGNRIETFMNYVMTLCAIFAFSFVFSICTAAFGAVGCDLNDPDRDVARLFPGSTGYNAIYTSITTKGSDKLIDVVETRLGEKNHRDYWALYDSYTIYEILNGKNKIGYIHGVNQKGQFGGVQIFLVLDLTGTIKGFYIQKMTNQYAYQLRDAKFGKQFAGLTIKDFDQYDVVSGKSTGKVAQIMNPAPEAKVDFTAILRATKKNLILMDVFVYSGHPQAKLEAPSK
jgi:hypothetical protein